MSVERPKPLMQVALLAVVCLLTAQPTRSYTVPVVFFSDASKVNNSVGGIEWLNRMVRNVYHRFFVCSCQRVLHLHVYQFDVVFGPSYFHAGYQSAAGFLHPFETSR